MSQVFFFFFSQASNHFNWILSKLVTLGIKASLTSKMVHAVLTPLQMPAMMIFDLFLEFGVSGDISFVHQEMIRLRTCEDRTSLKTGSDSPIPKSDQSIIRMIIRL